MGGKIKHFNKGLPSLAHGGREDITKYKPNWLRAKQIPEQSSRIQVTKSI